MTTREQRLKQAQLRAERYDRISIFVPKGKRAGYKTAADDLGLTLSMLIQNGVEEYIQNHTSKEFIAPKTE